MTATPDAQQVTAELLRRSAPLNTLLSHAEVLYGAQDLAASCVVNTREVARQQRLYPAGETTLEALTAARAAQSEAHLILRAYLYGAATHAGLDVTFDDASGLADRVIAMAAVCAL